MKKVEQNIIKITISLIFITIILILTNSVQAAGVDGTTIVLNPRTRRRLDRLRKWS